MIEAVNIEHAAIVLLAGGESKRLGTPKQLLVFEGNTLLRHSALVALSLHLAPVVVVTGAHEHAITSSISDLPLVLVHNKDWQEGMASSLRKGVMFLQQNYPDVDGAVFMVCDQPHVQVQLLSNLIETQRATGKAMVASSYGGKAGTPAILHRSMFNALLQLSGDTGARGLFAAHKDQLATIDFADGSFDIDTREDVEKLMALKQ